MLGPYSQRSRGRVRRCIRSLGIVVALSFAGCSDDTVTVEVASIISDPVCEDATGQFDLLAPGGVVLIVLIDDQTQIVLATGADGTCADLSRNANVEVEGDLQGQTLRADSIRLL